MNIDNIEITSNLIVVVGPTASGKTRLAIELAKKYDAEIVNADAFAVYKKMDIGTAKVKEEEKDGVVHHLFDIVSYDEEFDVAKYQKLARNIIDERLSENKKTIVVGGSTLYVQALLYDYVFNERDQLFDQLKNKNEQLSLEQLQEILNEYNITLNNSELNNKKRLINLVTKLQLNLDINSGNEKIAYYDNFQLVGIHTERNVLYDRVNRRVLQMIDEGLIDEVRQFEKRFYSQQAIGYKEVHEYFDNKLNYEQLIEKIQKNSRNFAKRQLTWYNNKMKVVWYTEEGGTWISYLKE